MKRLMLLIAGILMLTGTAMAKCGACEGDAEKAADKAAGKIEQGAAAADKAAGDVQGAKQKIMEEKNPPVVG